jgi:hypothetical protein
MPAIISDVSNNRSAGTAVKDLKLSDRPCCTVAVTVVVVVTVVVTVIMTVTMVVEEAHTIAHHNAPSRRAGLPVEGVKPSF